MAKAELFGLSFLGFESKRFKEENNNMNLHLFIICSIIGLYSYSLKN